ncbi:MAG: hypothetical protein OXG56_09395 [Gammaproteobacteria bacterium]|nr:hypothetical protein [Gammaproteobacteria bacterium]
MVNKPSGPQAIAKLLKAERFESTGNSRIVEDPAEPTLMVLPLKSIESSTHNPRSSRNASFEEIKQSIISLGGLITTLTVTRMPGEEVYRLDAGGNTRLTAIKAAYEETGDERLATLTVLFKPYGGETAILVNHLIENSLRSDNTFIEKAVAIQQTIDLLVKEKDIPDPEKISARKWIAMIGEEYGYPVHRDAFLGYRYALKRLAQTIPNALNSGMGKPTVLRIQRMENTYRKYCEEHALNSDQFEIIFEQALSNCDNDNQFDLNQFEHALLDEISRQTGNDTGSIARKMPGATQMVEDPVQTGSGSALNLLGTSLPSREAAAVHPELTGPTPLGNDDQEENRSGLPERQPDIATPIGLALAKREIFQAARDFAKPFGLYDLVNATEFGYGFYIEYPPKRLETEYQSACWWFLLHLSEILLQKNQLLWLSKDSLFGVLLKQFSTEGKAGLFSKFSTIVGHPSDIGEWVPSLLTHPDGKVDSLSRLLAQVHRIRQGEQESGNG